MKSFVNILIESIHFTGHNLGREWSLLINGSGISGKTNFYLRRMRQKIGKPLFQKSISLPSNKIGVQMELVEKDPKWNDKAKLSAVIDLSKHHQIFHFKIPVKGAGRREMKKYLHADVRMKIKVCNAIWMVADVNPNGWLKVKLENGTVHPLPNSLKVEVIEIKDKRLYFRILEGKLKAKIASVKYFKERKSPFFKKGGKYKKAAKLIYDRSRKVLSVKGLDSFAIREKIKPLPIGFYDLEIPYEPHKAAGIYQKQSRYSKTWFRIGHKGDHFLHPGQESFGCLAVKEIKKWTKLYKYLIYRRKDSRSVGVLEIK